MTQILYSGQTASLVIPKGQSIIISTEAGVYSATLTTGANKGLVLASNSMLGSLYGPYVEDEVVELVAGEGAIVSFEVGLTPVLDHAPVAVYSFDANGVVNGLIAPDGSIVSISGGGGSVAASAVTAGTFGAGVLLPAAQLTGTVPIANGGTGATTADAALTALGGTTVGTGLFKTATADAALTTLGATTIGNAVFKAADTTASATALGLTADTGASLIGFKQSGTGAVSRTLDAKANEMVSVKDFGAVGDGITDDTVALGLAAAALEDGQTLDFHGGTYLISYVGTPNASVYGNVVMSLAGKVNVHLKGSGAIIKVLNHNIAANGGLRFTNLTGCKYCCISGFNFDMTFTGVNTSTSYYPFCGAITAIDPDSAAPSFSTLNSDLSVQDCTFKLFHLGGAYALSGSPYLGDPNNGFKIYSVFVSGAHTPTEYDNQSRNLTLRDCTFKKGHNAYGTWAWAWNNCLFDHNEAEDWVSKSTDASGVLQNSAGIPMIRYIPLRTVGVKVTNNTFRAKPSSERTTGSGFEGVAQFFSHGNNLGNVDISVGSTLISDNNIVLGHGAASGTHEDAAVFFNGFGNFVATNNVIDGHSGESNVGFVGAGGFSLTPGGTEYNGDCSINVSHNIFGAHLKGYGIYFTNGTSTTAAQRRCKSLVVSHNVQRSGDIFIRMADYSADTFEGCANTIIDGNIIDGTISATYPQPSVNNYGIWFSANVVGDVAVVSNNTFINKTEAIRTVTGYVNSGISFTRYGNTYHNISTPYNAANLFPIDKIEVAQIKFPATQVASSDANTLDDYEEGAFTPELIGTTAAGVGTYTTQVGKYTKIGNRVFFSATMIWTAHTGTGNFRVNGLPFPSNAIGSSAVNIFMHDVALTAANTAIAYLPASSSQVAPFQVASTGAINNIAVDAAGTMVLSGHYDV